MNKKLVVLSAFFVTSLVLSNIISSKLMVIGGYILPVGVILFPVSYIIGDVLAEVFGYKTTRFVILVGFACNLFAVAMIWLAIVMPPANIYGGQIEFESVLGFTPRLLAASFFAYLVGEIANAKVMVFVKRLTNERFLWIRTISSTIVGQGLDSLIFISVAFFGVVPVNVLATMVVSQWLFKVTFETLATPATYFVVGVAKND